MQCTDSSMDRVPGFEPGGWRFEPSSVRIFYKQPMNKIILLSHTRSSFVQAFYALHKKGKEHAGLFYEEVIRKGRPPTLDHPAFRNAHSLLSLLSEETEISQLIEADNKSDGFTTKLLLRTRDNLEIETVLIPMQSGNTVCISTQVGCRQGCTFCETGKMGLIRHLKTEEITSQIYMAKHVFRFSFTNVVFMGMGEPFDNYDSVLQAARILIDPKAFGLGKRNVTISTSGKIEEIRRFTKELGDMPNLAVSINAPTEESRSKLMPINRKNPLKELYLALQEYNLETGRQILAAYVLIKGVNDSLEHAHQLVSYLKGLDVKVNIIPYNPQSRDQYMPPDKEQIELFVGSLRSQGVQTLLRVTKGRQIMAGCGQLGNLNLKRVRTSLPVA